ncbi:MAG TPA: EAL domain-containing protein [Thermoanaerobaculia bacterium]|nr:EAL domain-containing protein [Thermoanaerobaculia bacterium]
MSPSSAISARQFQQRDLILQLQRALDHAGIEPRAIDVEITEGVAMQNTDWTIGALHELKDLGVGIVLDDFGTGHSSLNYLRRFPIDCLKIDQSFVRELGRQPSDQAIVTAIITMARGLGLRIIAEGVETTEQKQFLGERGCDEIQGYLISPAVPPEELLAALPAAGRAVLDDDPLSDRLPS